MYGCEIDATQQPLARVPNPGLLNDHFRPVVPVQDVAAAPEYEICGQDERGLEQFKIQGDAQAKAMLAHLKPEEMGRALAYYLSRFAHNAKMPASELSMTKRAQAFVAAVNEQFKTAESNIRFNYLAGPPPRLEQRAGSARAVTIQIPESLLQEGSDVMERIVGRKGSPQILDQWVAYLRSARPPITNETLRTRLVEAFRGIFPEQGGEGPAQRAARIRALLPLINQHFHAHKLHVEIDNKCVLKLYAWTPGAPRPGRPGDLITPPMELMPADQRTRDIGAAVAAILNPTAPAELRFPGRNAIVAGLNGEAEGKLAKLIYPHLRNYGRDLLGPLNEALHAAPHRLHFEVPPPNTRLDRTELDIYDWNPGPPPSRGRLIARGIRMDQTIDVAGQLESRRQAMDGARIIGQVLAPFAVRNKEPDQDTRADVADYFFRRLARAERTGGGSLNERRTSFYLEMQTALRTQGLDIEFDVAHPDKVTFFRWENKPPAGKRLGRGIPIERPNYFAAPTEPTAAFDPDIDKRLREGRNIGFWEGIATVLVAEALLGVSFIGYRLYRLLRPGATTRPTGTDVDVSREAWRNLQRPFEDMTRRLAEKGGPVSGIERGRFDPRVLAIIDSAIKDAREGRVVWSKAEIEAIKRFRTAYDGLRTGAGPLPAEAMALNMMLDGTRADRTSEFRPDVSARNPVRLTGDTPDARRTDLTRSFEQARALNPKDPFFNAETIRSYRARSLALMDELDATEAASRPQVLRDFTRRAAKDLFSGGAELLQRVNIVANPYMDSGSTLGLHTFRDGSGRAFSPAFRDGAHFVENYTDTEGRTQQRRIPVSEVSVDIEVPASRLRADAPAAQLHETLASIYDQMYRINKLANMTAAEATHAGAHGQISTSGNRLADYMQHNINADSVVSNSAHDARALLHSSQPIALTPKVTMEMTSRGMVFRGADGREMTEEAARKQLEEEIPRETARIRRILQDLQKEIDRATGDERNRLIQRRNDIQAELNRLENLRTELKSTDAAVRDPARSRLFDAARRAYEGARSRLGGGRAVPFAFVVSEAIRLLAR